LEIKKPRNFSCEVWSVGGAGGSTCGDPSGPVQWIKSLLVSLALWFFIYPLYQASLARAQIKNPRTFGAGIWSSSGAGGSRTLVQIRYRDTVYMLWSQLIFDNEPDANALLKAYSLVFRACLEISQITILTYRYFNRASVKKTDSWSRCCL